MDLSLEQRKRLIEESKAIQREYGALQGDSPEVQEQKMKCRNRYGEIDRLLGTAARRVELEVEAAEAATTQMGPISNTGGGSFGRIKCPFCAEDIMADAKKCRHCGEWLEKAQLPGSGEASAAMNRARAAADFSQRCFGLARMSCAVAILCLVASLMMPVVLLIILALMAWLDS